MNEMVERVARAAYLEFSGDVPDAEYFWWPGKDDGQPYDWRRSADCTSIGSKGFIRCARAAIGAMRKSTEALKQAEDALSTLRRGYGVEVSAACYPALNSVRDALAMIDEALR